jgi:hypothetical protein
VRLRVLAGVSQNSFQISFAFHFAPKLGQVENLVMTRILEAELGFP